MHEDRNFINTNFLVGSKCERESLSISLFARSVSFGSIIAPPLWLSLAMLSSCRGTSVYSIAA